MTYSCTTFGDLKVPYFEIHEDVGTPYKEEEVTILPKDKSKIGMFEIPDLKVRSFKDDLVKSKREEAEAKGRIFFDGPQTRLIEYDIDELSHKVNLLLDGTSYFTFNATNKSLDNPEVRRMLEERGSSYYNLDDGLANPIGVNLNVISEPDNSIIITKRSEKLSMYPSLKGTPAGFFEPIKHNYNLFNAARAEAKEEAGIPVDEIKMIGLGRAGDDRHIEVLMTAKTPYNKEKILAAPKSAKWEHQKMELVPFEPKEVMKHLTETIKEEPQGVPKNTGVWIPGKSPAWCPGQWEVVKDQLINEFGFDEVWQAYEDTRHKQ
jgi:8-oxo-dGTP pyrophosphatase MutT (NUDIX family)